MSDPQKQPGNPIVHFLIGAVPATIATALAIAHIREPLVSHQNQGIFTMLCLALVCTALAIWLYYTVERECRRFDARHDAIEEQIDEIANSLAEHHEETMKALEAITIAIKGLHRRTESIERQSQALGKAFIEEGNPLSDYRGPRSLS